MPGNSVRSISRRVYSCVPDDRPKPQLRFIHLRSFPELRRPDTANFREGRQTQTSLVSPGCCHEFPNTVPPNWRREVRKWASFAEMRLKLSRIVPSHSEKRRSYKCKDCSFLLLDRVKFQTRIYLLGRHLLRTDTYSSAAQKNQKAPSSLQAYVFPRIRLARWVGTSRLDQRHHAKQRVHDPQHRFLQIQHPREPHHLVSQFSLFPRSIVSGLSKLPRTPIRKHSLLVVNGSMKQCMTCVI